MIVIGQKVGSFGAYRDGIEVYGRAVASADRQIVSLENASHYDLYDKPEAVGPALEKIVPFFKKHLKAGQGVVGAIKRVAAKAMSNE